MSITDMLTNQLDILKGEVPVPQYKVGLDLNLNAPVIVAINTLLQVNEYLQVR